MNCLGMLYASASKFQILVPTTIKMRLDSPTVTFPSSVEFYGAGTNKTVKLTALENVHSYNNGINLAFTTSSDLTSYNLRTTAIRAATFTFSADL